jgi:SWI/SNF chromatin-remodeling complex subunit SWI1
MGGTTESSGPTRKKIEYIPLAREIETYGGRDVQIIIDEHTRHRSTRDINEWGMVDVDQLTLSLRSRLPTELAYALETVTVLSTMRSQTPTSGFPIFNCPELMDELLDLVEDCAFDGAEDDIDPAELHEARIWTHREMVEYVYADEGGLFAGLKARQGQRDENLGPKQPPANYAQAVMTILRNFTTVQDNLPFLFAHPRLVDVVLRVCDLDSDSSPNAPQPRSRYLGLSHIITLRKDMLVLLTGATLDHNVRFSSGTDPTPADLRRAARIYNLIASFVTHEREALAPFSLVRMQEQNGKTPLRPPTTADMALGIFTHVFQPDAHRQVLAHAVSHDAMWCMFRALTHRLPVSAPDFQVVKNGEPWLAYLEKLVMAVYVLAFLAPPEVKTRMRQERTLRFPQVVMRMVHRLLLASGGSAEFFIWTARRAIEVMRLIDEARDCFDVGGSGPTTGPTLSFGVGYGEVGEQSEEVGDGLLGGYREMAWDMMMLKDVDDVTFMELDRLARVQY